VCEVVDQLRSGMVRMLVKPARDPVDLPGRKETAEVTMPWQRVVSADRVIAVFFTNLRGLDGCFAARCDIAARGFGGRRRVGGHIGGAGRGRHVDVGGSLRRAA
jgi:hypothetical protein